LELGKFQGKYKYSMKAQNLNDFKKELKFSKTIGTKVSSREGIFMEYKESFNLINIT